MKLNWCGYANETVDHVQIVVNEVIDICYETYTSYYLQNKKELKNSVYTKILKYFMMTKRKFCSPTET